MSAPKPARPRIADLSEAARVRLGGVIVASLLVVLVISVARAKLEVRFLVASYAPPGASFVLPSPGTARFFSAGYGEAAADAVWTKLLVYYGEETTRRRNPEWARAYVDAIITLDPMFRAPYAWVGHALPLGTTDYIDPQNVEDAIRILRAAIERFPSDGELHGMLGYNLFYELPRWIQDRDRIARAKIEGAEHLRAQAALGAGADWMVLSATVALREANLDELAARNLEEAAFAEDDPFLRRRILGRLAEIRNGAEIEAISRAAATLDAVHRDRFPSVPSSFFLVSVPSEAAQAMSVGLRPPPFPEDPRPESGR